LKESVRLGLGSLTVCLSLSCKAEIPDDELKRREEYLCQQRDRILEKKKKERQSQLKEYQQEQKVCAPEPVRGRGR
jgi:hypothetical protein